ncbi:hypothetical protein WJU23_14530 [Prosthecobacter sp. SYSU 5D2]|uniref:hypothetical protein n=1 Tax=Prosthecobacter sp. SYSU 5D2 TaxID=3134134 RepID=UPI0031FED3D9
MRSEYFDLIPGGGPALAGCDVHLGRCLFKGGAKEPDPPPRTVAPVRAEGPVEDEVARRAARRRGLQDTIFGDGFGTGAGRLALGQGSLLGPAGSGPVNGKTKANGNANSNLGGLTYGGEP